MPGTTPTCRWEEIGTKPDVVRRCIPASGDGSQRTGRASFTDVLLDVLQADDDDDNLSNGTPNVADILEGFDLHGITLFSHRS